MPPSRFSAVGASLALLAVIVVFFPTLFFGRVISPVGTIKDLPPWNSSGSPAQVANPEFRDTAATLIPGTLLAHRNWSGASVVDPSAGCGQAGLLSWHRGMLSPVVLTWSGWLNPKVTPGAIALGKLLFAFIGTFLLARSLGLSQTGAAAGSAVFALSLPMAANWFAPASATFALLPLTLWSLVRLEHSSTPWRAIGLCGLCLSAMTAGGDPTACAACYCVAIAWFIARLFANDSGHARRAGSLCLAVAASAAVSLPGIVLWIHAGAPLLGGGSNTEPGRLGLSVARMLVDPYIFGDPRLASYLPPTNYESALFPELVLSIGIVAVALGIIGCATSARRCSFWIGVGGMALAALARTEPATVLRGLPGLGSVTINHLGAIVALAIAVLAAHGLDKISGLITSTIARRLSLLVAVAIIIEQGLAAGHLQPFIPQEEAELPATPGLTAVLSQNSEAYRIAPLQDTLWPDTAGVFGLEDIRANRVPSDEYRRLLLAIDPQACGYFGSVMRLNAATLDYRHPYLHALGARWLFEPPSVHLVEFALGTEVHPIDSSAAAVQPLESMDTVSQELFLPQGCSRLGLPLHSVGPECPGVVNVALRDELLDRIVGTWRFSADDLDAQHPVWLDLDSTVITENRHRLVITDDGGSQGFQLRRTNSATSHAGQLTVNHTVVDSDLALEFDTSGFARIYEGPDMRVWENRKALPRFWMVRSFVEGDLDTLLTASPPFDLAQVGVLEDRDFQHLSEAMETRTGMGTREPITIDRPSPSRYRLRVQLDSPALIASSVPVMGSLWNLEVDGVRTQPILVNGLFIGIPLTGGSHDIVLSARIPPVWYLCAAIGLTILIALVLFDRRRFGQPKRTAEREASDL